MAAAQPRRWRFDLTKGAKDLPKPMSFSEESIVETSDATISARAKSKKEMIQRRVMEMALAPGKNIFMQGFMMWMSGNGVHIFSIMIVGMALVSPIKSILTIDQAFKRFASEPGVELTVPKLLFVACNLGMVGLASYKLNAMGLLPITSADWTSFLVTKEVVEAAANPIAL